MSASYTNLCPTPNRLEEFRGHYWISSVEIEISRTLNTRISFIFIFKGPSSPIFYSGGWISIILPSSFAATLVEFQAEFHIRCPIFGRLTSLFVRIWLIRTREFASTNVDISNNFSETSACKIRTHRTILYLRHPIFFHIVGTVSYWAMQNRLIRCLLYLSSCIRPEIAFSMSILARKVNALTMSCLTKISMEGEYCRHVDENPWSLTHICSLIGVSCSWSMDHFILG